MNLTNYYWYFKSAIPERICDDIVRYGKSLQDQMAVTGGYERNNKPLNQKQIKDLKKKRDSDIVWMSDRWIYKEIQPYIHQANIGAGWNFQWDFLSHVNLPNTIKVNTMIGTVLVGINLMINQMSLILMVKLENYLLQ